MEKGLDLHLYFVKVSSEGSSECSLFGHASDTEFSIADPYPFCRGVASLKFNVSKSGDVVNAFMKKISKGSIYKIA